MDEKFQQNLRFNNSASAIIGNTGEVIAQKHLYENLAGVVDVMKNAKEFNKLDYTVTFADGEKAFFEVKTRRKTLWEYAEEVPVFTFQWKKINNYRDICAAHGLKGYLVLVQFSDQKVYYQSFDELFKPYNDNGRKFPFDHESCQKYSKHHDWYFSINQFKVLAEFDDEDRSLMKSMRRNLAVRRKGYDNVN